MKKILLFSTLGLLTSAAGLAVAQEHARVLSSTPIVQQIPVPQQVCGNETVYTGQRTSGGGAILGAIAGGAAGNAVGGGNGRAAATAIGLIGGALLGNRIEGSGRPEYENVRRCTTQNYYENRTIGYTVVYEYAGRQYTTQTQNDPGGWIAVNVQPYQNDAPRPAYTMPVPGQVVYDQAGNVSTYPVPPAYVSTPGVVIEYSSPLPYERHHERHYDRHSPRPQHWR